MEGHIYVCMPFYKACNVSLYIDAFPHTRMLTAVPTTDKGVKYGLGVFILDYSDEGLGTIWGHEGW